MSGPGAGATYLVETAGHALLRLRKGRLTVEKGPDRKAAVEIARERATVGTAEGNDLRLSDPTVSRVHFAIAAGPDGWLLRDLGSTNGTFVDDLRVRECFLRAGSRLVVGRSRLKFEVLRDEADLEIDAGDRYGELVGRSAAMRRLFAILRRVAASDASVLLLGESGTGKELAARALHRGSRRADGPFVVVDCGALPETLVESELFGHVRGAFTGAIADRKGAFEQAHGGTLFLDEIGELPLEVQPKLLRALEAREVRPVGAGEARHVDVRVLAATSRDLRLEVNRGGFRPDVYFRLAVVEVELPPLRERLEDVPLLVQHFLDGAAERRGTPVVQIPAEIAGRFARRAWPGNVRELRNEVERFLALGLDGEDDEFVPLPPPAAAPGLAGPAGAGAAPGPGEVSPRERSGGMPPAVDLHLPFKIAKRVWLEPFENEYLRALVARNGGNLTQAAREAGLDRNYLSDLLRRYGLR